MIGLGLIMLALLVLAIVGVVRLIWKADRRCPICSAQFECADFMHTHFVARHPEMLGIERNER